MDSCCQTPDGNGLTLNQCPVCFQKGKSVQLITLKSMLQPIVLDTIQPELSYSFCANPTCGVVYFSGLQIYGTDALKVPVFQKNNSLNIPVCYCFGWTRDRIMQALQEDRLPSEHIREQIQANRCGCEVNNPQGSCCLGNVTMFIRSMDKN